jgi:hypothetical protein
LPGLVAGTVGLISSPGGVGKTMWILQAALSVSSESANQSLLRLPIESFGPVVVLNAEDTGEMIVERLHSIGNLLDKDTRHSVALNTVIESLSGEVCNILSIKWQKSVEDILLRNGARLCVLDTLSSWHQVDENSNSDMSKVMQVLKALARKTGAAIVLVHHTSKLMAVNNRGDEQQSARGASLLVDNARWHSFVSLMTEAEAKKHGIKTKDRKNYIRFGVSKQNYGMPVEDAWYQRNEVGVLRPFNMGDWDE